MKENYDAIVVGAGLAGLTSAAYLNHYGYKTLLLEKGKQTGGLVKTFWYQGFAFDAGIRAFESSGIVFPMLEHLGIDIDFVRNPVSVGIEDDWVKVENPASLRDYTAMLTKLFPENSADIALIEAEIRKVMGYMDVIYGIDNPLFLEEAPDPQYLMKTLLPWLLKYQWNIRKAIRLNDPVYAHLGKFTKNLALIDMIAQHFFKETPAFFALSYFSLYLDYCYTLGGTGMLAQKVTDYILSTGGEIRTETAVTWVDPDQHQVGLSDGSSVDYKYLVWAADQKALYASLKGTDDPAVLRQGSLAQKSSGGDSIVALFMGIDLDQDYFAQHCGPHAFYTPNTSGVSTLPDWHKVKENGPDALLAWVGEYLEKTTYEISVPSLRDASLAPEGKTGLIVSTLMDYELAHYFEELGRYQELKDFCTQKMTDMMEASLFPGIAEKILFSLCSTPLTLEKESSNSDGAITGWAFTNPQMPAENRFNKMGNSINTPIQDVYQCGQWSFSPSGLPVSILTGKLTADEVKKKLKK